MDLVERQYKVVSRKKTDRNDSVIKLLVYYSPSCTSPACHVVISRKTRLNLTRLWFNWIEWSKKGIMSWKKSWDLMEEEGTQNVECSLYSAIVLTLSHKFIQFLAFGNLTKPTYSTCAKSTPVDSYLLFSESCNYFDGQWAFTTINPMSCIIVYLKTQARISRTNSCSLLILFGSACFNNIDQKTSWKKFVGLIFYFGVNISEFRSHQASTTSLPFWGTLLVVWRIQRSLQGIC